ncbi:hypothetical protein DPMN_011395 [Dreissena polymorpha]|uniref:Uncharacterized protein n=2 Tax=Dreissena polymorpha TaxID=45954 RepID=A0A9D4N501_DREPO|nr:hypothetical protein DPMN_011395 [Dreissena polymorpha]
MRFVHDGVIFMYVYLAGAIISVFKTLNQLCVNQNLHVPLYSIVNVLVFLFASSHLTQFYCMNSAEQSKWTYGGIIGSAEVNSCLNFIGRQNDVNGIFIDRPIYMTGGYSIVHKDVPLVAMNKYEFLEFDEKSTVPVYTDTLSLQTRPLTHNNNARRLKSFGHISDFISIYNTPYLYKKLIIRTEYNYFVLEEDREFEHLGGFVEVFRTQSSKVMRRTFEPHAEQALLDRASKIPIGTNATVLEHEGHWLAHYGLYKQAEERLVFANYIAPRELGPYRRLLEIYQARGNTDFYSKVLTTCMQFHSMIDCTGPYKPLELHSEYFK